MNSALEHKEQAQTETPVLLFACRLRDGSVERWSSHRVRHEGHEYEARVIRHNVFEMQTASEQAVDSIPKVSITVANVDGRLSQLERSAGLKGSVLTVSFVFYNLREDAAASDALVLFQGLMNPPEELTETQCRITAVNRMSLQRVFLPDVRIQRRCPWRFPSSVAERTEAVDGGPEGRFSKFYRCGYSADVDGGAGNLDGAGAAFTSCDYSRAACVERGMFERDSSGRLTSRFGGVEFVPASSLVRGHGDKAWSASPLVANEAKYNDPVPLVYGTVWYTAPIVFSRNDGNLTRIEVLLGAGEIEAVHKVLVNRVEIPLAQAGKNMTGTGWYNVVSLGNRNGGFNYDFRDAAGNPLGDPYGSMAYLSVVVPNQVNDGKSTPKVEVLLDGLRVSQFDQQGQWAGDLFTRNPAWILLDVLRRSGWRWEEMDLASFARAAAYADEEILATDIGGATIAIPRYEASFVLKTRKAAADVVRGIRANSRLLLTYSAGGVLVLKVENAIALEQPSKPEGSNAAVNVNGGWPAYEFGDGTDGTTGILRLADGSPSVRVTSRTTADTPNRFALEFQDRFNSYQQDSLSLVDVEDAERSRQEITGTCHALGVTNFSQAARVLKHHLSKSIEGNAYVEFETTVRALGLRPGDLIALTYLREGFSRQLLRVVRVSPGMNYRTARVFAQVHRDEWYEDTNGLSLSGEKDTHVGWGIPRPVAGVDGDRLGITERAVTESDGTGAVELTIDFVAPGAPASSRAGMPSVSLSAVVEPGGSLAAGEVFYYALSGVDEAGVEGALSFAVRAAMPETGSDYRVRLTGIRTTGETDRVRVYRGESPWQLRRIGDEAPAGSFVDDGRAVENAMPVDANYHHTNVYWRLEHVPETAATEFSDQSIGNQTLQMPVDIYRGYVVRITDGAGVGQELTVTGNDATTLWVGRKWVVMPDATSRFAVAESAWQFGGSGGAAPVIVRAPNRAGATVHVTAISANAQDQESPAALAPVTRWLIGGMGSASGDTDRPPVPEFGLSLMPNGGGVEIAGVSFTTLENTRSVTTGTVTLHYWDELNGPSQVSVGELDGETLSVTGGPVAAGDYVQVDREVMRVEQELVVGTTFRVTRGALGTQSESHEAGTQLYKLAQNTTVVTFPRDFFGSPASGTWSQAIALPYCRVAAAELFVTNTVGNSDVKAIAVTQTLESGLRTMGGGQFCFSVSGFLAVESGATPDVVVDRRRSIRDVYAVVRGAPVGGPPLRVELMLSGESLCSLEIPSGALFSSMVDGFELPVLTPDARLSLNVTSVGYEVPGSDLTVTVRV